MGLLVITGLYNVRQYYWEMAWGRTWLLLTLKIGLAFTLFGIILALTLPLGIFDRVRARRRSWLIAAFALGVVIVLISAYLRSRG
jgi:energy-converting hydrogenase Eha subunit A